MAWIPGVPTTDANIHGYRTSRPMAVCHRTYGGWGGDYSVIQSGGLAHLLVGKEEGQWVQFGPTEALMYHCNGANDGYGIEMTGVNEDDFTDWQVRCLRYIVPWLSQNIGVPMTYSDQGWINGHTYVGFHSHNGILTDDGSSQHTNLWKMSDWAKVVQGAPTGSVEEDDDVKTMYISKKSEPALGIWVTDGIFKRHVQPDEWQFVQFVSGGSTGFTPVSDQWWDSLPSALPDSSLTFKDLANVQNLVKTALAASPSTGGATTSVQGPMTLTGTFTGNATPV